MYTPQSSQGNATKDLRWGENFNKFLFRNSLLHIAVKKITKIGQYLSELSQQESPAIADKPTRRESLKKFVQFDVLTTLSLTILAYLHSFSCCCVRNLRNSLKNLNLWSSSSSKDIDLGVNRKPMYDFLLVTNSNFGRICYRFRDIDA